MAYTVIDTMNATNTNQLIHLFTNLNTATDNVFSLVLVITVMIAYMFLFGREQRIVDWLGASFVTSVFTFLLFFAGLTTTPIAMGVAAVTIALFVLHFWVSY